MAATNLIIRPAKSVDSSAISDCVYAAFKCYIPRIGKPPGPMLDNYEEVIETHQVFVAVVENSIVGLVALSRQSHCMLLDTIVVHPSFQGNGFGKKLLAHAEQEAKRQGYTEIQLYTHEKMTENKAMYQKLGYVEIERRVENGYRRIYMKKQL